MIDRLLRLGSRISIRLLTFNVLLVFLPAAGVLFLDTYENRLLQAQEQTMVQDGRLLAAALEASGRLHSEDARRILIQLSQRHEARLRVVDHEGRLLADSAHLGPRREPGNGGGESTAPGQRRGILYQIGSFPFRLLRRIRQQPGPSADDLYDASSILRGPEIRKALDGRYGAATRLIPGDPPSVILYCAIPVRGPSGPVGAVLVSQSTFRILSTLDAVRVGVFKVFLASLGVALALTLVMATTIARPLARLRRQAEAILDRRGRLRGVFTPSRRRDEIGDLERALAELTRRLESHIQAMESFASDVAHEFRNPLASIRTATEMALDVDTPEERKRFLTMIHREVARMERLLTGAREISRIDARIDAEEPVAVNLAELVPAIVEGFRLRLGASGPQIVLAVAEHDLHVAGSPDHLTQVFDNVLANAVSFSPDGGAITVTVRAHAEHAVVTVADEGPGIPEEHLERVFSRFFTYRPEAERDDEHTGLGLAMVRAIVTGHGGSVSAENRPKGGALITVRLPRSPMRQTQ